jgi:hypothetical protein
MFVFLVSRDVVLLQVIHLLKAYQHTKFDDPNLTGESFASTSEV